MFLICATAAKLVWQQARSIMAMSLFIVSNEDCYGFPRMEIVTTRKVSLPPHNKQDHVLHLTTEYSAV